VAYACRGVVAIGVVVTSKGLPDDAKVVKSLEKDVDRCALDAVKQWRFAPAKKDGKPVAVHITIEIEFHSM
jgi:periplasmic protein TonB